MYKSLSIIPLNSLQGVNQLHVGLKKKGGGLFVAYASSHFGVQTSSPFVEAPDAVSGIAEAVTAYPADLPLEHLERLVETYASCAERLEAVYRAKVRKAKEDEVKKKNRDLFLKGLEEGLAAVGVEAYGTQELLEYAIGYAQGLLDSEFK